MLPKAAAYPPPPPPIFPPRTCLRETQNLPPTTLTSGRRGSPLKKRERDKRGETNEATPFFLHGKFLYPLLFPLHTYYLCLPKLMVVLNGSLIVLYVQHHLT